MTLGFKDIGIIQSEFVVTDSFPLKGIQVKEKICLKFVTYYIF